MNEPDRSAAGARPGRVEPLATLCLILSLVAPTVFFVLSPQSSRGSVAMALLALILVAPFGAMVVGAMALGHIRRTCRARALGTGMAGTTDVVLGRRTARFALLLAVVEIVLLAAGVAFAWAFAHSDFVLY